MRTCHDVKNDEERLTEALSILAQEYLIAMQPRPELLIWTVVRLILSWYCDDELDQDIYKIRVLINLFRGRSSKVLNQEASIMPVIQILPKYGVQTARRVLARLSVYFVAYGQLGWGTDPTYFTKTTNLLYHTSGSIELKRYLRCLLRTEKLYPELALPDDGLEYRFTKPVII
jgi:hypothetical protein